MASFDTISTIVLTWMWWTSEWDRILEKIAKKRERNKHKISKNRIIIKIKHNEKNGQKCDEINKAMNKNWWQQTSCTVWGATRRSAANKVIVWRSHNTFIRKLCCGHKNTKNVLHTFCLHNRRRFDKSAACTLHTNARTHTSSENQIKQKRKHTYTVNGLFRQLLV